MLPRPKTSRSTTRSGGSTIVVFLLIAAVMTAGVVGAAAWLINRTPDAKSGPLLEEVRQSDFIHDVVESGEVESSDNLELRSTVKGRNSAGTAILEVRVAEGDIVEEGQVLVVLDSSAYEQEERQEEIILNNKRAAMIQAENLWEAAKLARTEYLEGTFKQEEQALQSEVFVAEENLRRAQEYARFSERLAAKGYVTALQLESDRFAVEKSRKDLESAQTKLHVLRTYTQQKTLRQLESDIRGAEAAFNSEKSSFELQQQELMEIRNQIEACTLRVPDDGDPSTNMTYEVVFATEHDRRGNSEFVVEPGAIVRERQTIVRLPNSRKMRVNTKISEAKISLIREGMAATVTVDAFDGLTLEGRVTHVSKYPEPSSWFSSSVKEYKAMVELTDPPANLKPGLTAKVRIHTEYLSNVTKVPIQAVYHHRGRNYCLAASNETWSVRPVELGSSNEKFVVITSGLESGDLIAANPANYIDEVQLPSLPAPGEVQLVENQRKAIEAAASPRIDGPTINDRSTGGEQADVGSKRSKRERPSDREGTHRHGASQ